MCCTDGVRVNGRWVHEGDEASGWGVYRAVREAPLQALAAEASRGGLLGHGLGFSSCRVAVVTNVSDDHLGQDGIETVEQMAAVKERLVQSVGPGGAAVLNLDDPRVRRMTPPAGARRLYFSLRRPAREIRDCFFADDDALWSRLDGRDERLMHVDDVTIARRGLLPYHLANALAALAALEALGPELAVSPEQVVEALREFGANPNDHPYTFTHVAFRGRHVLLDMGKNPEGYRHDCAGIARLRELGGYENVIGVLSHVGNREVAFHHEVARQIAEVCDGVIVVPPKPGYLRGVAPEALVARLREPIPPEKRLDAIEGGLQALFDAIEKTTSKKTLYVLFEPVVLDLEIPLLLNEGAPVVL
jgi:cyanophycin synthetase